jgi:hypothetical protein
MARPMCCWICAHHAVCDLVHDGIVGVGPHRNHAQKTSVALYSLALNTVCCWLGDMLRTLHRPWGPQKESSTRAASNACNINRSIRTNILQQMMS